MPQLKRTEFKMCFWEQGIIWSSLEWNVIKLKGEKRNLGLLCGTMNKCASWHSLWYGPYQLVTSARGNDVPAINTVIMFWTLWTRDHKSWGQSKCLIKLTKHKSGGQRQMLWAECQITTWDQQGALRGISWLTQESPETFVVFLPSLKKEQSVGFIMDMDKQNHSFELIRSH